MMPKRTKQSNAKSAPAALVRAAAGDHARKDVRDRAAHRGWLAAGVLALAVGLVYGRALDVPFLFDDSVGIMSNESIRSLWPLVGTESQRGPLNPPKYLPTSGRPLVNLSLALNYHFGGLNPGGYHLINVTLHFASALLLCAIVRHTLRLPYFNGRFQAVAGWLALATAALWALHPLHTESVIYTIQRTELMVALFYLATLYCSLRYWKVLPLPPGEGRSERTPAVSATAMFGRRGLWLTLAVLACLAGMASKEVMVSAPLVVLLFERTFVAGSLRASLRNSWPLYAGLACGWALLLVLNANAPRDDSAGFHLGVPAYAWWFTQAKVLLMYLKLTVWPASLLIHYDLPYLDTISAAWIFVLPVELLVVTTLILLWRNHPVGFLATAFFAVLSPTLIVPITTETAAERRMYLPLAALAALVVVGGYVIAQWWTARLAGNGAKRRESTGSRSQLAAVIATVLVIAVIFGVMSAERLAAYYNPLTLWQDVVSRQPYNAIAHQNLGTQLFARRRTSEALGHYREAVRLDPDSDQGQFNLALALLNTGQAEASVAHFREAVRLLPGSAEMRNNLGVALFTAGQNEEAIAAFQQTLELEPTMWRAHDNLATALKRAGRLPEAIENYGHALRMNPTAWDIYGGLADAHARAGQPARAIATMERALDIARTAADYQTVDQLAAQLNAYRARLAEASRTPRNPPAAAGTSTSP